MVIVLRLQGSSRIYSFLTGLDGGIQCSHMFVVHLQRQAFGQNLVGGFDGLIQAVLGLLRGEHFLVAKSRSLCNQSLHGDRGTAHIIGPEIFHLEIIHHNPRAQPIM